MSRVETLEQKVTELEQRLEKLEKPKVNLNLDYNELHHILIDVALGTLSVDDALQQVKDQYNECN